MGNSKSKDIQQRETMRCPYYPGPPSKRPPSEGRTILIRTPGTSCHSVGIMGSFEDVPPPYEDHDPSAPDKDLLYEV